MYYAALKIVYLVVEYHHAYKIWCLRWTVKEKAAEKGNSSNSSCGYGFCTDKTAGSIRGDRIAPVYSWSIVRDVIHADPPVQPKAANGSGRFRRLPGTRDRFHAPGRTVEFFNTIFQQGRARPPPETGKIVLIPYLCCIMYTVDTFSNGSRNGVWQ
jgi:hypothetical protein